MPSAESVEWWRRPHSAAAEAEREQLEAARRARALRLLEAWIEREFPAPPAVDAPLPPPPPEPWSRARKEWQKFRRGRWDTSPSIGPPRDWP